MSLAVDRPVIGLGASAPLHYATLPDLLNQGCVVPEDTDVANALGAVVGVMMWMWLCTVVVLIGAQLNAEIEHQTARDSTVGPEAPLGARGAIMADTVGAAQT